MILTFKCTFPSILTMFFLSNKLLSLPTPPRCLDVYYCDILPLWQFSTVTLRPCKFFLLWHSDTVTIFYCDILSQSGQIVRPPQKVDGLSYCDISTHCNFGQPMAETFCPLRILISSVIPCQSCSWCWQMTILWHYPFNFFASTHQFRRYRSDRGYGKRMFFWLFFQSDHSFGSYSDFFAIFSLMIMTIVTCCPPHVKQAQKLPDGSRWTVTKPPHFASCDIFLLWHSDSVTISTVTLQPSDIFLLWHSISVTVFYCDTSTM